MFSLIYKLKYKLTLPYHNSLATATKLAGFQQYSMFIVNMLKDNIAIHYFINPGTGFNTKFMSGL